jgi:hypothetical protein
VLTRLRRPGGPRPHGSGCCAVGTCVALACSLLAGRAAGEGNLRLSVEWEKLGALLRPEGVALTPSWRSDGDRAVVKAAAHPESRSLFESTLARGRWSLVARDWDAARLLMGRLAATDEVKRGSRSKRMALLRGRLLEGPIAPFAQLGLGQWRFDPDMPATPRKALIAGQLGIGAEYVVASWVSIAFEADCTVLDPGRLEASQPGKEPAAWSRSRADRWVHPPALWGGFLATTARF